MRLSRKGLYLTLLLAGSSASCGGAVRGADGDGEGPGADGSGGRRSGGTGSVDPVPPAGGRGPAYGGRPGSSGGGQPGAGGRVPAAGGARVDPGGCPWGDSLVCRCSEEIYGAMDCLPDGSGYTGICICEVPISCDDDELNAAETDVDCGGGECRACPEGWGCKVDYDCLSLQCGAGYCVTGP